MADELLRALGQRQRESEEDGADVSAPTDAAEWNRPFDASEREALLDRVFEQVDATDAPRPPVALRRTAVAVAVALAAMLLAWWVFRWPTSELEPIAMVPRYELTELRGGTAPLRAPGEPKRALTLTLADEIDCIVTPEAPVRTSIAMSVLARPSFPGGAAVLVHPTHEVSEDGAVRLRSEVGALGPTSHGRWELDLLVGPSETLPQTVEAANLEGPWSRVTIEVTIVDTAPDL